ESCGQKGHIAQLFEKYQACNDRVNGKSKTTETCMEELFDYYHELDHCVAKDLWPKLNFTGFTAIPTSDMLPDLFQLSIKLFASLSLAIE
uniref:Ubiquinol-cytochrome C reductase hinge domain-containing protein n=1 Tax=Megaselia scalaris TaxID=36166 RepID=T1GK42_MEGSC